MEPLLPTTDSESNQKQRQRKPSLEYIEFDPISKYNYFISVYNNTVNKIDDVELKTMHNSTIFRSFNKLLNQNWGKFTILLLILVAPFLNFFLYVFLLIAVIQYEISLSTFKSNFKRVPHPFKNMVYHPELCQIYQKNHYIFQMQITGKLIKIIFTF